MAISKFPLSVDENIIFCKAELKKGRRSIFLKLALDTGASLTMISYETVMRLGLNPSKSNRMIDITTGSGIITSPIVKIPVFRSLGQQVKNLEVACHDLPVEGAVDGLLGLNFLEKQLVVTTKN